MAAGVKRGRSDVERAAREAHVLREFEFLVSDHGYRFIGAIPLATAGIDARAWANPAAGVQVEISSVTGRWFLGILRRLVDGVPVPYADWAGWLEFSRIALARTGELEPNHNLDGWPAAVSGGAELLRSNPGLVDGREWISRREGNRAWNRWMSAQYAKWDWCGEDASRPRSPLDPFREAFAFLVGHGYHVTADTDRLSPHEYLVPNGLRYEKDGRSVSILQTDFRDWTWSVAVDGQPIGDPPDFSGSPEEIASRAALVARAVAGA